MLWYLFGSKNKNDWFDQTYFGVINFIVLFVLLELLFYFFGVIKLLWFWFHLWFDVIKKIFKTSYGDYIVDLQKKEVGTSMAKNHLIFLERCVNNNILPKPFKFWWIFKIFDKRFRRKWTLVLQFYEKSPNNVWTALLP